MIILLAGDLHYNIQQFQWLKRQKENYDCLCLTGDFISENSDDFSRQVAWVSDWMRGLDKQIFVCSGNHDCDDLAESDWINNLNCSNICADNQTKRFGGIKFGCIPYLGADLYGFADCEILVTHVPPFKTKTAQSVVGRVKKNWGDKDLYDALDKHLLQPRYLLCGHVENPVAKRDCIFGVEIINPGAKHNSTVPSHEIIAFETNANTEI